MAALAPHIVYFFDCSSHRFNMDDNDAFFTRSVVGPPVTVVLGRRQRVPVSRTGGLEVSLAGPGERLAQGWRDWLVLDHMQDSPGQPRRRPGRLRRGLERHALGIALAGLVALLIGLVLMLTASSPWK
jgi:hypothetical protein